MATCIFITPVRLYSHSCCFLSFFPSVPISHSLSALFFSVHGIGEGAWVVLFIFGAEGFQGVHDPFLFILRFAGAGL